MCQCIFSASNPATEVFAFFAVGVMLERCAGCGGTSVVNKRDRLKQNEAVVRSNDKLRSFIRLSSLVNSISFA